MGCHVTGPAWVPATSRDSSNTDHQRCYSSVRRDESVSHAAHPENHNVEIGAGKRKHHQLVPVVSSLRRERERALAGRGGGAPRHVEKMRSRAARLFVLTLFLVSAGVTAYLFWRSQRGEAAEIAHTDAFGTSVRIASRALLDVRMAQGAYVAAGQGGDFWAAKVAERLDGARKSLTALAAEAASTEAKSAVTTTQSMLDDFAKIDRRALDYVRANQRLMASDLIFTDGLELTDAALASLEHARSAELTASAAVVDIFRRRQTFALVAGAAAAVLAVLLLLPHAEPEQIRGALFERTTSTRAAESLRPASGSTAAMEGWSPPRRAKAEPAPPLPAPPEQVDSPAAEAALSVVPLADHEPPAISASAVEPTDFGGVAALCSDLARVVDTRALPGLLERTASLLDASGIVLWIADPDGRELIPIFAQGYPPQLVTRLGTIPSDAENATAAAFRTSLLQTVRTDEISAGAIAAPLVTPGGCVGVMAAEVRHEGEQQNAKLAAATIVAAQLATLVGPPSARNHAKNSSAAGA
jgi:cbb3-type cytochrome oxidase subunit 3